MALITTKARLTDFSVRPAKESALEFEAVRGLSTIGEFRQVTRAAQSAKQVFETSPEPRGLAVKSITLTQDSRSFLEKFLDPTASIYYLAWCWDLSGDPVRVYPGLDATAADVSLSLRQGESKRFMGAGSLLFPQRKISAGLAVRLMVWESEKTYQQFGETLKAVCDEIKESNLNSLITLLATVSSVPGATLALIEKAGLELGSLIGTILKASSDDFLDLYEGYFPVSDAWDAGEFTESDSYTEMVFTRIAGAAAAHAEEEFGERIARAA